MGEIVTISSLAIAIIFACLSLLHFSWALGSSWGFESSLPTNQGGQKVLNPRKTDSIAVGVGLGLFSAFYGVYFLEITLGISDMLMSIIRWMIPIVFLMRTIGDFKYVGLFKKVKGTSFAIRDSSYFVPLCFCIACLGFLVAIFG